MARHRFALVVPVALALPVGLYGDLIRMQAAGPPLGDGGDRWLPFGLLVAGSLATGIFCARRSDTVAAGVAGAAAFALHPAWADAVAAPPGSLPVTAAVTVTMAALALASLPAAMRGVSMWLAWAIAIAGVVHAIVRGLGADVAALAPAISSAPAMGLLAGGTAHYLVRRWETGTAARRVGAVALVAVLAAAAVAGRGRVASWETPVSFWSRAMVEDPTSPVPRAYLAASHHGAWADVGVVAGNLREFVVSVEGGGGARSRDTSLRLGATNAATTTALERLLAGVAPPSEPGDVARAARGLVPGHPGADLLEGESLLRAGDAVSAATVLRRGAADPGADAAIHEALARALLASGAYADALRSAHVAIGHRPDKKAWIVTYAEALLATRRFAEALNVLHGALGPEPRDPGVVRAYGDAHLRLAWGRMADSFGGRGRARRLVLAGLSVDRSHPGLKEELERLDALRESERPSMEALLRPDADGTVHPNNAIAFATWLCRWGDYEGAEQVFQRVLKGRGSDPQVHFYYAFEVCEGRETREGYTAAVRGYRQVLLLDPEHIDARARLWDCLRILEEYADAAEEARRFVKKAPAHPAAVEAELFLEAMGQPPR
jgi:tetratricopeptide (TPR) repeat protein